MFEGRARCAVTVKSGHTLISDEAPGFAGGAGGTNAGPTPSGLLVAAFAADIPVMLARIASEIDLDIKAMSAKVSIEYSPRGIAGFPGYDPSMQKAVSDIWIVTGRRPLRSRSTISRRNTYAAARFMRCSRTAAAPWSRTGISSAVAEARHCAVIPAFLITGTHLSISLLRKRPIASGVWSASGGSSFPRSNSRLRTAASA